MRILVRVGPDLPENRKMSKGQGFLSTINQLRVSRLLSHILTEYDDGQQVNIPVLVTFIKFSNSFQIGKTPEGVTKKKIMDRNEEKFSNSCESAESKSQ